MMKYRILLSNTKTGEHSEIIVPHDMILEELSVKIKMECHLPYTDWGHHQFLTHGTTYVVQEDMNMKQEIMEEAGIDSGNYACSESVRLDEVFTTKQSSIIYIQEEGNFTKHKVRCTLIDK